MKIIYSFFLGLLFYSAFAQSGTIKFEGTIKNATKDTLYIISKDFKKAFVPDAQGFFNDTFSATTGLYELIYGEDGSGLFLKAGSDLKIIVDAKDFSQTLTFSGKGEEANNFLALAGKDIDPGNTELMSQMSKLFKASDADFQEIMLKKGQEMQEQVAEKNGQKNALKALKGKTSPEFAYKDVNDNVVKLSKLKGKFVYIDVWATWCGPCRMEIPYLKEIEEKFKGKQIEFVSISLDKQKDSGKWKKMIEEKALGGTQLLADNEWDSTFVKAYLIDSIPRFILIGPDGKIVDADAKRPSDPELQAQLDALLK